HGITEPLLERIHTVSSLRLAAHDRPVMSGVPLCSTLGNRIRVEIGRKVLIGDDSIAHHDVIVPNRRGVLIETDVSSGCRISDDPAIPVRAYHIPLDEVGV